MTTRVVCQVSPAWRSPPLPFFDRPEHGPFSPGAGAFRYIAKVARLAIQRTKPGPEAPKHYELKGWFYPIPLEKPFEDHARSKSGRRRV